MPKFKHSTKFDGTQHPSIVLNGLYVQVLFKHFFIMGPKNVNLKDNAQALCSGEDGSQIANDLTTMLHFHCHSHRIPLISLRSRQRLKELTPELTQWSALEVTVWGLVKMIQIQLSFSWVKSRAINECHTRWVFMRKTEGNCVFGCFCSPICSPQCCSLTGNLQTEATGQSGEWDDPQPMVPCHEATECTKHNWGWPVELPLLSYTNPYMKWGSGSK